VQKDALLALGLLGAASLAGAFGALWLLGGLVLAILFPQGAPEVLPLAVAPLLVRYFRALWTVPHGATCAFLGALLVALLAALQGLGLSWFAGSTSAFSLPYRALTGPLGNPNHLASFLLLSVALGLVLSPKNAEHVPKWAAWPGLALAALVILWSRSHAGSLGLALVGGAWLLGRSTKGNAAIGLCAGVALLVSRWDSFSSALAGRWYLARVHWEGFSWEVALRGIGPGAQSGAFLHWQAAFLEKHPGEVGRWSFPEYAHNDLIALVVTWGFLLAVVGFGLLFWRTRWRAENPRWALGAGVAALLLVSLSGTVLYVAPVWLAALALWSALTEEFSHKVAPGWAPWVVRLAALGWLALSAGRAVADHFAKEATERAISGQSTQALALLDEAARLPSAGLRLDALRGRVLVEAGRFAEAIPGLEEASQSLPHPSVFQSLAACYQELGQRENLLRTLDRWRHYAPADPLLAGLR
jgi:hypothetical protein